MITRVVLCVSISLAAAQGDWVLHEGKGFTVKFPGKPSDFKQTVQGHTGPVEVKMLVYENDKGNAQFVVGYYDFSEADLKAATPDRHLDNARLGAVKAVKGALKEEKKIKLGDHPGRDLLITTKDKAARIKLYAVDKRLYKLAVVGPASIVDGKDAKMFFASFKLSK
jgi:hypothetical protein